MLKDSRAFLEPQKNSDSYYKVTVYDDKSVELKLADCSRSITWYFGKPGERRAIAKISKIKTIVDRIYAHLTQTE